MKNHIRTFLLFQFILTAFLLQTGRTFAHCDGLDGPVVTAARKALETGNINLVLIWVHKDDENAIRDAFKKTMHVRKFDEQARELADTYFFETLVRIHRAGEGEAYTGLKPAGRDLGPVIPAADESIKEGNIQKLKSVLEAKKVNSGKIDKLFSDVIKSRTYDINDVEAGRKFVASYVRLLHTSEELYAAHSPESHSADKKEVHNHDEH